MKLKLFKNKIEINSNVESTNIQTINNSTSKKSCQSLKGIGHHRSKQQ